MLLLIRRPCRNLVGATATEYPEGDMGECDNCGECHNASTPCRTPDQIMGECAPPPGYADQARDARVAALARLDNLI
jgi:hypothetical protein